MIINENGFNKIQINSTLDMDATGRIIKRSLMLNIRENDVKMACKLYEDLKSKIEGEGEKPKKRVKKEVKKEPESIETPTCDCGSPMILRSGKWGSFFSCSTYPLCRLTKPYQEQKEIPADEDLALIDA